MKKKILSLLLAITLICTQFATTPVKAEDNKLTNGVDYVITSDGILKINNTVKVIPDGSFRDSLLIKTVEIPSSVTTIKSGAFSNCTILQKITFAPNSELVEIGDSVFSGCYSLTDITLPEKVSKIGNSAFDSCTSLTTIGYGPNIMTIGSGAFANCRSLSNFTIPQTTESLGNSAFYNCISLKTLKIPNIKEIPSSCFANCKGVVSVTIPSTVHTINNSAFSSCTSLTSIDLSSLDASITAEDKNPGGLRSNAFSNCTALQNITLSNKIRSIPSETFRGCSKLTNITIPDNIVAIDDAAFANTNLNTVRLPANLYAIDREVFRECKNLVSINIPSGVVNINAGTFAGCTSLNNITIPNNVTSIGENAFEGCNKLTSIVIPDSVVTIKERAFNECRELSSIKLSNKCDTIGVAAFRNCEKLTKIELPEVINTIGDEAFAGCTKLAEVWVRADLESVAASAFNDVNEQCIFYCDDNDYVISYARTHGFKTRCLSHEYTQTPFVATCAEGGGILYTCKHCDYSFKGYTSEKNPNNHVATTSKITKATLTKDGKIAQVCTACKKEVSSKSIPKIKSVNLAYTYYNYTGKNITPKVIIKLSNGKTYNAKIKREVNNWENVARDVGSYKYTIKTDDDPYYSFSKTFTIYIKHDKFKITKTKRISKTECKITYKRPKAQCTDIVVQYSTKKSFKKKYTKTDAYWDYIETERTYSSLKKGKKYYVRMRTYYITPGTTKKIYSAWSNVKTIKAK